MGGLWWLKLLNQVDSHASSFPFLSLVFAAPILVVFFSGRSYHSWPRSLEPFVMPTTGPNFYLSPPWNVGGKGDRAGKERGLRLRNGLFSLQKNSHPGQVK